MSARGFIKRLFQFPEEQNHPKKGIYVLLAILILTYAFDHILQLPLDKLYLNHNHPEWYQFVTSIFLHAGWQHLSGNIFFLYIFGGILEEELGTSALTFTYLFCGVWANLISFFLLSANYVSMGASGALFGIFAVSILLKIRPDWRRLVELLVLGQFFIFQVFNELSQLGANDGVNRVAHLAGALMGLILFLVIRRLLNKG